MALTIAVATRALMLDGFEDSMEVGASTANFTVYQGNTSLAVFPLNATPFGAGTNDALTVTSAPIDSTGTEVAGTANRFILTNQNGTTVMTGTISAVGGGGDIEVPALTVTAAATQTLNSLVLRMAVNGAVSVEASLVLV